MTNAEKNAIRPFSDNIIFYDSEFSSLNPYEGEILSIGMVRMNGDELYLEVRQPLAHIDPWVAENVVPYFRGGAVERTEAAEKLRRFIGDEKPYLVSFVNQYDTIFLHKLFEVKRDTRKEVPQHWIHVDFASILFGFGENPESYRPDNGDFLKEMGIDTSRYNKHFALDDAKLLRDIYVRFYDNGSSNIHGVRK